MPFVIWGQQAKSVDLGPAGGEACPACGQDRPFRWRLDYRHNHVYYLFGFVSGKEYSRVCEVCGRGARHVAAEVEASLGRSVIPWMERFGCLAALGGAVAVLVLLALFTPFFDEPRNVPALMEQAVKGDRKALARLRAEAGKGDLPSQEALAELSAGELGPPADWNEAFRWAKAAAEGGSPRAQHLLGWMYQGGHGTPADPGQALPWYRKAEAQGNAASANALGVFHLNGIAVPADPKEALRYFRKSAEAGDVSGCYNLSGRYVAGDAVPRDLAEARRWLERAAATPDRRPAARTVAALALFNLGQMYEEGAGAEKDLVKALRCYEEASPRNEKARAAFERLKARLARE